MVPSAKAVLLAAGLAIPDATMASADPQPVKSAQTCGEELRAREADLAAAGESPQEFFHRCWYHSVPGRMTPVRSPENMWNPGHRGRGPAAVQAASRPRRSRILAAAVMSDPSLRRHEPHHVRRRPSSIEPSDAAPSDTAAPAPDVPPPVPAAETRPRAAFRPIPSLSSDGSSICADLPLALDGRRSACLRLPVPVPPQLR